MGEQLSEARIAKGLEVSRRRILLEEPIRRVGEHDVEIRLHPEVRAQIKVHVLADQSAQPEDADAAEEGKETEDSPEDAAEAVSDAEGEAVEAAGEDKPSGAE